MRRTIRGWGQAGGLAVASARKLHWTKEVKFARSPNGWYRVELPSARWWDYLLMPLVLGVCGATLGVGFTILCINQFYTSLICLLIPVGPFILIAIGSVVGFLTSIAWWHHAYEELKHGKVRHDIRVERALKRSLKETHPPQQGHPTYDRARKLSPPISAEEQETFGRILGDIPQPRTTRWQRLDPANLPPYPLLPDCCHRPLARARCR
ncbi:MAG: hypothetical protein N2Z21_01735 [Candidatus Sumerlaeaceae bacterium]|nr:hypothetical protein [Candidatus Sumerlaeaceae bacterium]